MMMVVLKFASETADPKAAPSILSIFVWIHAQLQIPLGSLSHPIL